MLVKDNPLSPYMYIMLCVFTIKVIFYQVKMLMFYNVQATNLTSVDKK